MVSSIFPDHRSILTFDAPLNPQPHRWIQVERFRQSGLELHRTIPDEQSLEDAQQRIPVAVRLGAQRIVQEALTNVLRHAGPGTRTDVEFAVGRERVRVAVFNDVGPDAGRSTRPGGYGLRGLSERAAALGGWCRSGNEDGRFAVVAEIPVGVGFDENEAAGREGFRTA